jgi:hypothetical protein
MATSTMVMLAENFVSSHGCWVYNRCRIPAMRRNSWIYKPACRAAGELESSLEASSEVEFAYEAQMTHAPGLASGGSASWCHRDISGVTLPPLAARAIACVITHKGCTAEE